jgi:ABC-type glycerol-3-phosphate transport system permease component
MKWNTVVSTIAIYLTLIAAAAIVLIPIFWMVSTAFKLYRDTFHIPPMWFPPYVSLANFQRVFLVVPFGPMMFNSLKVATLGTLGQVLSCTLGGYAVARMRFVGRQPLFLVILATMMVPYQVVMIPIFIIMKNLGWVNTHTALIVPAFLGGAFGIFLMRQFFLTLPSELEDAARIDGANPLQIFSYVILPLARPALTALAALSFTAFWNDLLTPLIYLSKMERMTMPVGISFFKGMHSTEWNLLMAAALMNIIPAAIIFLLTQRQLVSGIALSSGIKG